MEEESKENSKVEKEKSWQELGWYRDYNHLTEHDKLKMKVDEIFALYLFTVAKKVNKKFYFLVLRFIVYFRECLNEIGWQKKRESD